MLQMRPHTRVADSHGRALAQHLRNGKGPFRGTRRDFKIREMQKVT